MAIRSFAQGNPAGTMALLASQNTLNMQPYSDQIKAGIQGIQQVAPNNQMRELLAGTNATNYQENIGKINALAPQTGQQYRDSAKQLLGDFGQAGTLNETIANNQLMSQDRAKGLANQLLTTEMTQEGANKRNENTIASNELIAGNNIEAKENAVTDDVFKTDYMQDANGNMQQIGITKSGKTIPIGQPMSADVYGSLFGKTGKTPKQQTWIVPSGIKGKEPTIYYGEAKEGAIPFSDYTDIKKDVNTPEFLEAIGNVKAEYAKNPTEWVNNELDSMTEALNEDNYLPRQVPDDLKREYKNEIRSIVNNPEMLSKYILLDSKGRIDMLNKNIGRNVKPSTLGALIYGMPDYEYDAKKSQEDKIKANMYLNTGE